MTSKKMRSRDVLSNDHVRNLLEMYTFVQVKLVGRTVHVEAKRARVQVTFAAIGAISNPLVTLRSPLRSLKIRIPIVIKHSTNEVIDELTCRR